MELSALHFLRLHSPRDERYPGAMALYGASFPPHEQREQTSQHQILTCGDYHFNLIYDDGLFVGILLCWQAQDFIYVEHFCIQPQLRGRRYGQRALELLRGQGKPVILEIDPPVDEVSKKRRTFYQRAGFHENPYPHVHPPYHQGVPGHALTVMSCPAPLGQGEYGAFLSYLRQRVMGVDTP